MGASEEQSENTTYLIRLKKLAQGFARFDTFDSFAEEFSHRYDLHLLAERLIGKDGVGDEEFFDGRIFDRLDRVARKHSVRRRSVYFAGAIFREEISGAGERAASVGEIIRDERHFAFYIADEFHPGDLIGNIALFVDDREVAVFHEALAVALGTHYAASVWRDDDQVVIFERVFKKFLEVGHEHPARIKIVDDGAAEESADRVVVQIHGEEARGAQIFERHRNNARGDRLARFGLFVLARIAEKRHDDIHLLGGGAVRRVQGEHEADEIFGRRIGRLDEKDVLAAKVFEELDMLFPAAKRPACNLAEWKIEAPRYLFSERVVGTQGEYLVFGLDRHARQYTSPFLSRASFWWIIRLLRD